MDEYKFYSYVDDKSILVITPKNKLVRIKCPFAVMDSDKKILQVDAVSGKDNLIYYKIQGSLQIYNEFTIIAK
jgi:hypothetical protein